MVLSEGQLQSIETAILRMSRFRRSANPTDQTKGENFTYVLFALDIKAIVNDRAEAEKETFHYMAKCLPAKVLKRGSKLLGYTTAGV